MKKLLESELILFAKKYFHGSMLSLITFLVLIFLGVAVASISPYLYGEMLDLMIAGDLRPLTFILLGYIVITIITSILGMIESYYGEKLSTKIVIKIQKELHLKILKLKCKELDQFESGELVSILSSDSTSIIEFILDLFSSIISIAVNFMISFCMIIVISKELTLVSIIFVPLMVFQTLYFKKKFKKMHRENLKFGDYFQSFVVSAFSNIMEIKALCLESTLNDKYEKVLWKRWHISKRIMLWSYCSSLLSQLIEMVLLFLTILTSAWLIQQNILTIGIFVTFQTYIVRFFTSLNQILSLNLQFANISVSLERVKELFDKPDENISSSNIDSYTNSITFHHIQFKDVNFQYKENLVLKNFNLELTTSGLYCITGENGCGKSTFMKLIMKFYDCDSGTILIDGNNIEALNPIDIRSLVSYVGKSNYIPNDTILTILKLNNTNATEDEIISACKKVGLNDFLSNAEKGYETLLGEDGKLLSSGQKQKLSIARCLLSDSSILLLDEITSDLDYDSEKEIMAILKNIGREKMVLLISHRESTISKADFTISIEDGGASLSPFSNRKQEKRR